MAPLKQKGDLADSWSPHGQLERIQVKYCTSDGVVVPVKRYSHSLTNGRVRDEALHGEDGSTGSRNNQSLRIRYAADFLEI